MTEYNKSDIAYYKSLNWTLQLWKPSAALVDKTGFPSHVYVGQKFDPSYFNLDPEGWTHDHCELCSKTICENPEECETSGYNSGNQWLCISCYNSILNA